VTDREASAALDRAEREIYAHIVSRNPEHDFEPTLDRVREACDLLGNPQHAFKVIHLTGTNGKTSTARMAESLVRSLGLRTGLFTSPHLTSVRERIQIDGEPISKEAFVDLWADVSPILELVDSHSAERGGPRMSFFEVLTVLAFAAFADAPIDVCVLEVGMGGSWDATNVADADVAVIGPVALDHENWLGHSLEEIAAEKSGIIKPSSAVVVAAQAESAMSALEPAFPHARVVWHEVAGGDIEVVERHAAVGGQLVTLRTPGATYEGIFIPLFGAHQAHNAALALAAVEALMADGGDEGSLPPGVVEQGFARVTSPGRLETVRRSPTIVVDAAHNPHGIDAVASAIEESFAFSTLVGVVCVLDDKDADGILAGLEPFLDSVVITKSSSPRALDPHRLGEIAVSHFGEDRVVVQPDLPSAIDQAVNLAETDDDMTGGVLVIGSISLVADVRTMLGADRRLGAPRV
jgi:dihydrofolate synthase/folylpolyglutamate synthase